MKSEIILEMTCFPSEDTHWFSKEIPIGMVIPVGTNLIINNMQMLVYDVTYKIPGNEQVLMCHTHIDDDNFEELEECILHIGWAIHEHVPFTAWEED